MRVAIFRRNCSFSSGSKAMILPLITEPFNLSNLGRFSHIALFFSLACTLVRAAGVWTANPGDLPVAFAQLHFRPDLFNLKSGAFDRNGKVKPTFPFSTYHSASCGMKYEVRAWIAHRLGKVKELKPEAGKALGTYLSSWLTGACISEYELDIEPLPEPPGWLVPFLKATRAALSPNYALRLAVPTVTPRKLPAPALSWKPDAALEVLDVVDGLDLMIYDTASSTAAQYAGVVADALDFAARAREKFPSKSLLLGFPAYRTTDPALHDGGIEGLAGVRTTLKDLAPAKAKVLCDPRVRMAYYPDEGVFNDKDKRLAQEIEKWKAKLCQPGKP